MKKKVICLLLLCLFTLSSTAFATNWVLAKDSSSLGWKMLGYIDSDTVFQKDNTLIFWYVFKLIKPLGASQKVQKIEAILANHQFRILENHNYVNGKQTSQSMTPSKFYGDSQFKDEINMALKYAKDSSSDDGSVPTPP